MTVRRIVFFVSVVLCLMVSRLPFAFADFKLLDAIEEFGEKRFIKPTPVRIKTGPINLHPVLRSSAEYDSNILSEKDDPHDGVVFNIKPGMIVEVPIQRHQIALGYESEFEVFTKRKQANQNDQNQLQFALADFNFPSWYVNVLQHFSETSSRSGTTFTDRIPRFDNSVNPKVGFRWKRAIFESGFLYHSRNFRRTVDNPLDFHFTQWSEVFYYDLFARLKALLEYSYSKIDYEHNPGRTGHFHQVRTGFVGEVLPNLTVKLRVGAQFRNYEEPKPDFYSWVGDLTADYQIRQNLKLSLNIDREPVEATFGDVNFYKEHGFRGRLEYEILPRWIPYAGFKYIRHKYAERATLSNQTMFRKDHHYIAEAGLRYLMREWLEFQLGYEFARRDSNFSGLNYTDNRVIFSSNLSY